MKREETGPVEILSPEGVEERLVKEAKFQIMMTLGGKFRIYSDVWEDEKRSRAPAGEVHDTLDKANEHVGGLTTAPSGWRWTTRPALSSLRMRYGRSRAYSAPIFPAQS